MSMIGKKKQTEDPQNYIIRKEYKKAIDIYRDRLKEQPNNTNLRLALADALLANSQVAEALREYKDLAAKYTAEHFILKAVAIYKKMLKIRPDMKDVEKLLSGLSEQEEEEEVQVASGDPEVFEVMDSDSDVPAVEPAQQQGLLKELSPEEFKQLIARLSLRHFEKDVVIVKEGDRGDSLFIIVRGSVRALTKGPRQKEIVLGNLGEGDFFGEVSLLTGKPRTATIITTAASDFLELTRADYESLIKKYPHIKQLMQELHEQRAMEAVRVIKKSYREGA
jgi:cAMP-dependent protein kinase regulator